MLSGADITVTWLHRQAGLVVEGLGVGSKAQKCSSRPYFKAASLEKLKFEVTSTARAW